MDKLIITASVFAVLAMLLVIGMQPAKPKNYAVVAQEYTDQCIVDHQAKGTLRGQPGSELYQICELNGALRAHKEMCQVFPEDCR